MPLGHVLETRRRDKAGSIFSALSLRNMAFDRERFMEQTWGYSVGEWELGRDWITRRLYRVARDRSTITYSDLCAEAARAGAIRLEPHDAPLAALLGQVNVLEHEAGRPLISALVVHKTGDWQPGVGFWSMARDLGIDPGSDDEVRMEFWVRELENCYTAWGR